MGKSKKKGVRKDTLQGYISKNDNPKSFTYTPPRKKAFSNPDFLNLHQPGAKTAGSAPPPSTAEKN